jgi:hypothetical protein
MPEIYERAVIGADARRAEGRRSFVTTAAPALNDRQRAYLLAILETD